MLLPETILQVNAEDAPNLGLVVGAHLAGGFENTLPVIEPPRFHNKDVSLAPVQTANRN